LPLHHTYECTIGFLTLIYSGASISFNEGLKYISKNLKEVKPTVLVSVPLILENAYRKIWENAGKKTGMKTVLKLAVFVSTALNKLFKADIRGRLFKEIHENLGGRLRLIVSGAAALDPVVSRGFENFGILVLQGYGLTECSPLAIGNRDRSWKHGSLGVPIPGVEVRIDNPDGRGIGEIAVKGDNVMLGYYQDEEATKKALKNGWLYTGDLGIMDRSGFFFMTGRSKNVIVTKNGKNIYPEELEAYINKSPFVSESLVWGKHDKASGETFVNAQIFPNLEAIKERLKVTQVNPEEISKLIREVIMNINKGIPLYKRIKGFSLRDNEFVKTTTKKIKRHMANVK
jgi:long-chain acyl-CoA synthetase